MIQGYEFTSSQNELIGDLGKKMNFVGILTIVGGVLSLILGIASLFIPGFGSGAVGQGGASGQGGIALDFSSFLQGLFLLITGLWIRNAAQSFKRVVTTTGSDIENILGALGELRKLYNLQYWLAIALLVTFAVILIAGLIATVART
ncbi:MAG: hypothetical protein KME15_25640 [Drouetiella hepatica Uher 2000/2452]|jgi:hypothetical protein|uniref:Uncharacterized protein n=1 Tax=Drouetiella hepatica Uher 2000/2452 TaxID=904376 RepID=A0A951QHT7_9CYAN|nr:hypothetical protein [Drouetiella hepatica Uher 2000/2452]